MHIADTSKRGYRLYHRDQATPSRFDVMLAFTELDTIQQTSFARRRAIAIANANLFRAMACRALRDGKPQGELRAANARTAARIVLRQARRDAVVHRMTAAASVVL